MQQNKSPLLILNISSITDLLEDDSPPTELPYEHVEDQLRHCEAEGYTVVFLSACPTTQWHTVIGWLESNNLLIHRQLSMRELETLALRSYVWTAVALVQISAEYNAQEVVYVAPGAQHLAPFFCLALSDETLLRIRHVETLLEVLEE